MVVSYMGGTPKKGWFIIGHPPKIDDLGVPLFKETPVCLRIAIERRLPWKSHLSSMKVYQ